MTIGLATSWIDAAYEHITPAAERWSQAARALDVRTLLAQRAPAKPRTTGGALRASGVQVLGLCVSHAQLPELLVHAETAAQLRARQVIVDGGTVQDRAAQHEAHTESLVRALYPAHTAGVPLAIVNAGTPDGLLDLAEASWVLEELSGVRLVLDAAHATRAAQDAWGAGLDDWLEAFAGRTIAVLASGLGRAGEGRGHPEDGPLDWSTLGARVSQKTPWIFDPAVALAEDEVVDGLRALKGLRA